MTPLRTAATLLLLLILPLAGLPGISLAGDDTAGNVVAARGQVTAARPAAPERPLATKAPFFVDDTVKTGQNGRVQLMFRDNTMISLGASTVMKIDEYAWDAGKKSGAMSTRIEEGTFRVLGGLITKQSPEKFKTQTPAATIGIRGSMYAGSVHQGELLVLFQGGRGIYVENEFGRVEIDTPGFGTRVKPGQAPEEPFRLTESELATLFEELNKDDQGSAPWNPGSSPADSIAIETTTNAPLKIGIAGGATIVNWPSHGRLIDNGDGTFTYIPDDGWSGVDSFSYKVTDAAGQTITETIIITVSPAVAGAVGADFPRLPGDDPAADAAALADDATTTASQDEMTRQVAATAARTGRFMSVTTHRTERTTQEQLLADTIAATRGAAINVSLDTGDRLPEYVNAAYDPALPAYAVMSSDRDRVFVDSPARLVYASPADGNTIERWSTADNRNEFYSALTSGRTGAAFDYDYQALEVGGQPTGLADLPTAGVSRYDGVELFRYYDRGAGEIYGFTDNELQQNLSVNWHAGKFIGLDTFDTFVYGNVSGNQLTDIVAIRPYTLDAINSGTGDFGTIYGSVHQGLGLGYAGFSRDAATDSPLAEWTALSALTLVADEPHSTGMATFAGYAVGPVTPVGGFTGSDPLFGKVTLNLDRDAGTLAGSLTVIDSTGHHWLHAVNVGGNSGSAYINDALFLAETGCTGNCVDGQRSLANAGNVLFTDPDGKPASPHLSWGEWNVYFPAPGMGAPMTVSANWSYWVAGEQTPAGTVQRLIDTGRLSANYQGEAMVSGTQLDNLATIFNADGTVNLSVDFGARTVDGAISFTKQNDVDFNGTLPPVNVTLSLSDAQVTASGFTGTISGLVDNARIGGDPATTALATGQLQGGFYGPRAEAVGGGFSAAGGNDYYWGVFAAGAK